MNLPNKNSIVDDRNKQRNLMLGIVLDVVGMLTYFFPLLGETFDVIWAPIAGLLLAWMYKGKPGKIGGIFSFLEEIIPFTDVIPTFTLMWFYTYYIKKKA